MSKRDTLIQARARYAINTLRDVIAETSERKLSQDPATGVRALSSLAHQHSVLPYDEREVLLKRSVAQLVILDLNRVIAATDTEQAAQAYIALTHTMIRLARTLIKEDDVQ